jgi:hypothetical protein
MCSLELLIDWHQRYKVMTGRIYGWPDRHLDLIANATGVSGTVYIEQHCHTKRAFGYLFIFIGVFVELVANTSIPNPNADMDLASNQYW